MTYVITLIPGDGIGPEVTKPDLGGSATTTEFAKAIIKEMAGN